MAAAEAQRIVSGLAAWRPVPIDLPVLERAWFIEERFALSWWDALIVSAAQGCECRVLLTEDLQHGPGVRHGPGDRSFRVCRQDTAADLDALS